MWLFIAALGMLFASSMLGYLVIRFTSSQAPHAGTLHLPAILWLSTATILAASLTIHRALAAVRVEQQSIFRRNLIYTLSLAVAFICIQTPALIALLRAHAQRQPAGPSLYGLLFFLILLHAAHVVGGVVMLGLIAVGAFRGRFDHEDYQAVRNTALYWHFLDIVWLAMFISMWMIG